MAARVPYPVTGTVYDTDGTTVVSGAQVKIINVTNSGDSITVTTDAVGEFVADLADDGFSTDYANNDKLQMVAYVNSRPKASWYRHTVNTILGFWTIGAMYLHAGNLNIGSTRLNAFVIANHTGAVGQVDLRDVENDDLILSVELPTNGTSTAYLAQGIKFLGGICIVREADTSGSWSVALVTGR